MLAEAAPSARRYGLARLQILPRWTRPSSAIKLDGHELTNLWLAVTTAVAARLMPVIIARELAFRPWWAVVLADRASESIAGHGGQLL